MTVDEPRAADLALARACARGEPAAIAAFEATYFGEIDAAAQVARAGSGIAGEARQVLRRVLFVNEPGRTAAVAGYAGRGDLRGWVRVIATREVLRLLKRDKREVKVDDEALLDALSPATDPELGYLRELYRQQFKEAFHAAVAALEARERGLLRCALIDGMGVDALGRLHGVHKGTASRWLAAARQALLDGTRRELGARMKLEKGEVESMLRLVSSRLDVSLERALRTSSGAGSRR